MLCFLPLGGTEKRKKANSIHTGPEPGPGGRGVRAIDWIGAICISRLGLYLSRRHTHVHTDRRQVVYAAYLGQRAAMEYTVNLS